MVCCLAGCKATGVPDPEEVMRRAMLINPGMSRAEVIQIMGTPDDRSFRAPSEALIYCGIRPFGGSRYITVWLNAEQVIGVTNYQKRDDIGNCGQYIEVTDWGQLPSDISIQIR